MKAKNWKLEASLWQERFENAAKFNARFEGQVEKMGELLHLCREGFFDIEKHSIDCRAESMKFWLSYVHEIAYNMNKIIFEAEEKHGLPIRTMAQTDGTAEKKVERVSPMAGKQ